MSAPPRATIRLDKWLWFARFFKTRSLAAKQVSGGHVRLNGARVTKPAQGIGAGDVLTFAQGHDIRVVEIAATGTRRGPAPEAATLFLDRSPERQSVSESQGYRGKGRPTKKDRRDIDLMSQRAAQRRVE